MKLFMPETVFFDSTSLKYPLGEELYRYFQSRDVEIIKSPLHYVSKMIPGNTEREKYARAKKTLVITTKKKYEF